MKYFETTMVEIQTPKTDRQRIFYIIVGSNNKLL